MHTFIEHVQYLALANRLAFLETFYPLDSDAYDALFEAELEKLIARIKEPTVRGELEDIRGFRWTHYIAASVRNSGVTDPRELDERTHEIASKMLLGGLFTNYDPSRHGAFGHRFRASVRNATLNQRSKDRTRRRYIPSVPISDEPGVGIPSSEIAGRSLAGSDEGVIEDFRDLVHARLGPLGLAVFDFRMQGDETKALVGSVEYGEPTSYRIKQIVIAIKQLAKEFARQRGDEDFENQIERAMDAERRTVEKRFRSSDSKVSEAHSSSSSGSVIHPSSLLTLAGIP